MYKYLLCQVYTSTETRGSSGTDLILWYVCKCNAAGLSRKYRKKWHHTVARPLDLSPCDFLWGYLKSKPDPMAQLYPKSSGSSSSTIIAFLKTWILDSENVSSSIVAGCYSPYLCLGFKKVFFPDFSVTTFLNQNSLPIY